MSGPEHRRDRWTALVTGATDGIGRQTAMELAARGAQVLIHGRDSRRCAATLEEIRHQTGNQALDGLVADLASQAQVRLLARQVTDRCDHLDLLIHNAGLYRPQRELTADGIELTFAVNHLAPFLLTHLLLDLLKKSVPARIVTVSSSSHWSAELDWANLQGEERYDGLQAYALSKLGNILFTLELAGQLSGTGVTANCLDPGNIDTKLLRAGWRGCPGEPVTKGVEAVLYLAVSPTLEGVTGQYFEDNRPTTSLSVTQDPVVRRQFWELSATLTHWRIH